MPIHPVSLELLRLVFAHMEHRVTYELGAKAVKLSDDTSQIHAIDCSGFTRYALARATLQALILPDGSQAQREWCEQAGLHCLQQYSDVQVAANDPRRLFIAFLSPHAGQEWPRHVWLIYMGRTMESCGSLGVASRAWDNPNLIGCPACFELLTA